MGKFKRISLVLLIVGVLAVAAGCSCSADTEMATETTSNRTTTDRTTERATTDRTTNSTSAKDDNVINGTTDNGTTGTGLIDEIGSDIKEGITETTSNDSAGRNITR